MQNLRRSGTLSFYFFDKMKSHFVRNVFLNGFLLTSAVFVSRETISRTDEMNMMLSLSCGLAENVSC